SVELRNAYREYKQKKADLIAEKGNEKHEEPEQENQTNTGSSQVMNDKGTEMIEPTTKDTVTQEVHMTEAPDKEEYAVTQQDSPGVLSIPEYMRGNENLRDELDTLPSTSNKTAQSKEYLDPMLPETLVEFTEPNDPEWLQPDEFTTVVYKRSKASRKGKLIDNSVAQELENRKSPYSKKGRG
ncbi:6263_t:CDS:2, partial [Gigaspora margarita]